MYNMHMSEKDKQIAFRTSSQFFNLVEDISKHLGRPKTQIIEEAVRLFAKGDLSNLEINKKDIMEKINVLTEKSASLEKELQEIKTLVFQILKNQHG